MKEYKAIRCKFDKLELTMNTMAQQGWIVKAVNNDGVSTYIHYGDFVITFEREKA